MANIEQLKIREEVDVKSVKQAEEILSFRRSVLASTRKELCDAYTEKYAEYIGKRVIVVTEKKDWMDRLWESPLEGYFEGVQYDGHYGFLFIMAKVKKNGEKSLNYYTYSDSPKVECVTRIHIIN